MIKLIVKLITIFIKLNISQIDGLMEQLKEHCGLWSVSQGILDQNQKRKYQDILCKSNILFNPDLRVP